MSSIVPDGEVPYLSAASVRESEKGRFGLIRRMAVPAVLAIASAAIVAMAALHGGSSNAAAGVPDPVVTAAVGPALG